VCIPRLLSTRGRGNGVNVDGVRYLVRNLAAGSTQRDPHGQARWSRSAWSVSVAVDTERCPGTWTPRLESDHFGGLGRVSPTVRIVELAQAATARRLGLSRNTLANRSAQELLWCSGWRVSHY
jgi:hypothetical protein